MRFNYDRLEYKKKKQQQPQIWWNFYFSFFTKKLIWGEYLVRRRVFFNNFRRFFSVSVGFVFWLLVFFFIYSNITQENAYRFSKVYTFTTLSFITSKCACGFSLNRRTRRKTSFFPAFYFSFRFNASHLHTTFVIYKYKQKKMF